MKNKRNSLKRKSGRLETIGTDDARSQAMILIGTILKGTIEERV
jgi:hypothetical protein